MRNYTLVFATFAASLLISGASYAQSDDCLTGLEKVEAAIYDYSQANPAGDHAQIDDARSLVEQAQSANDTGDNARCMLLLADAQAVMDGLK